MNRSTITAEQQASVAATLAGMPNIPAGVGSRENACSIAAINLALTGKLTDEIPDCMSLVIGKWVIKIQDSAPAELRNSDRWRRLLPLAAGTGRDKESRRTSVAMDWMWSVVLPQLQPLADRRGFGEAWQKMCDLRTRAAANCAVYAANAANAVCATAAANAANAAYAAYAAYAADADAADAAGYATASGYASASAASAAYATAAAAANAANAADAANAAAAAAAAYTAAAAAAADAADAAYTASASAAAAADAANAADDADFWHSVDPCGCLERMINLSEGDRK